MTTSLSRRQFVVAAPGVSAAALALFGPLQGALAQSAETKPAESPSKTTKLWPDFPRQDPALVKAVVGASHFDEAKVRELVDKHPALARATWDWGFGDWESALGAAAHTGRRNIAEYLLQKGARLDIFAAAMLGMTDAVKAMIAASPGIQRTHGPHGFTLLAHARAGGEAAKGTLDYLSSLGDADTPTPTQSLSTDQKRPYVGKFRFGAEESDHFEVKLNDKGELSIERVGDTRRVLNHVGDHAFFPAGAPSVRIHFDLKDGAPAALRLIDHDLLATASRVST